MKKLSICLLLLWGVSAVVAAQTASRTDYLQSIWDELRKEWPANRTVNFVFHGHSVPSGYARTPVVGTLDAYPYQTLALVKRHFPYAVVNTITTAIGGENAEQGAERFTEEVLCHRPDVLFIDYALNDRRIGLDRAEKAWRKMIESALGKNIKVILCTPTPDLAAKMGQQDEPLSRHADMIRSLAKEYHTGLCDFYARFCEIAASGEDLSDYMSQSNHPNAKGHQVAVSVIAQWVIPEEGDKK